MAAGVCPRCGTRLLANALACINCELPIPAATAQSPLPPAWSPPAGSPPQYVGPVPYAPGYYPTGPTPWSTNGMAVASLVLAILWLGGIGSVLGVIFGHVARRQIKRRPQRGAGVGLAGLIIGYVGVVASVVLYASLPAIIDSNLVQDAIAQQDIRGAASAERDVFNATGSYTNDGQELGDHGFAPFGHDSLYAAYNRDSFCVVGGHNGGTHWYLYESTVGGFASRTYASAGIAETSCTLVNGSAWARIA